MKVQTSHLGQTYQRVQGDVFTPPNTPRPQFYVTSSPQQNTQVAVSNQNIRQRTPENDLFTVVNSSPEMTRQLRELLQKQQIDPNVTGGDQQPNQTRIWVQGW